MSDTEFRPIQWESASHTDVGATRKVNEDALIMRPEIGLWAVADGMGGHAVGDIAAQKIIDSLQSIQGEPLISDFIDEIDDALIQVNKDIIHYSETELDNASMGSTVVSLVIRGRIGVCLWVGDSRLYRYRNNNMSLLSTDHSQVEEMVQLGVIKREEAEFHPQKNVITRAVGGESDLYVDLCVFNVQMGDTYMLCSDGLSNTLSAEELEQCLNTRGTDKCAEVLINKALDNSPRDNVSLVLIKGVPSVNHNRMARNY